MDQHFRYFDIHTHKKYADPLIGFVRNAYHHLSIPQLNKLAYHFSIGIHPWDVRYATEASINHIHTTAKHHNCIAIGECGLDYFIKTDRDFQKKIFQIHLDLAEELAKPLIIHCVRAYNDLIPMLKNTKVPIILHHYTGNLEITPKLLQHPSVYFSFGKQLFIPNFNSDVFDSIPIERIVFETDNGLMHIEDVYEKAALLFDLDFENLIKQIKLNTEQIFTPQ